MGRSEKNAIKIARLVHHTIWHLLSQGFLYDGAHLVLLCIPLPSLTGRVESTTGLPFAGNISENEKYGHM